MHQLNHDSQEVMSKGDQSSYFLNRGHVYSAMQKIGYRGPFIDS